MRLINNIFASIRQNKLIFFIFIISLIFTYSYTDFSANMSVGSGHVYVAKSLALSHNFNIDEYWGNAGVDVIKLGNNYFSAYAPFNAVLMAIPYFALQIIYYFWTHLFGGINGDISLIFESLAFSLPSSLALVGILILLKKYIGNNVKISSLNLNLLTLGTGLGTLLFSYSVSYFNHVISAFFIFSAFYILSISHNKKYLFVGILTGLAFLTEFPTVLFCFAVLAAEIFLLISRKKKLSEFISDLFWFSIPVATSVLIILAYNQYHFGDPFLFAESILREQKAAKEATTHSFSQNPIYGLYGELFSPLKGLFIYSPFLIFGVFGIKSFLKRNQYSAILAMSYTVMILFIYSLTTLAIFSFLPRTRFLPPFCSSFLMGFPPFSRLFS